MIKAASESSNCALESQYQVVTQISITRSSSSSSSKCKNIIKNLKKMSSPPSWMFNIVIYWKQDFKNNVLSMLLMQELTVYYSLTYILRCVISCSHYTDCSETGVFVSKHGLKLENAHFPQTNQIPNILLWVRFICRDFLFLLKTKK